VNIDEYAGNKAHKY